MEEGTDQFQTFGPRVGVGWDWSKRPPVRGKPFRAEFEEIHTRKPANEVLRCKGSVAQDSAGRLREDVVFPDPEDSSRTRHITVIFDTPTATYYFIDQETKHVQKIELERIVQEQLGGNAQGGPAAPEGPLPTSQAPHTGVEGIPGERLIEGVLCRGSLVHEPGGRTVEHWSSEELGLALPVLEITRAKDLEIVYRLSNIQLTEPDPTLFTVPENP